MLKGHLQFTETSDIERWHLEKLPPIFLLMERVCKFNWNGLAAGHMVLSRGVRSAVQQWDFHRHEVRSSSGAQNHIHCLTATLTAQITKPAKRDNREQHNILHSNRVVATAFSILKWSSESPSSIKKENNAVFYCTNWNFLHWSF